MIFIIALQLATLPTPLSLDPLMDENEAAQAFEAHFDCLVTAAFGRRADMREAPMVAKEVVSACMVDATKLRAALTDVFRRKPQLLHNGHSPEVEAAAYVSTMNDRVEAGVRQGREKK